MSWAHNVKYLRVPGGKDTSEHTAQKDGDYFF